MAKKKATKTAKPSKRASFKSWIKKKFLAKAQANIRAYKFTPGVPESHEQGIARTAKLETAQAVFDAIREIHDSL
jgi:hypothetical protein